MKYRLLALVMILVLFAPGRMVLAHSTPDEVFESVKKASITARVCKVGGSVPLYQYLEILSEDKPLDNDEWKKFEGVEKQIFVVIEVFDGEVEVGAYLEATEYSMGPELAIGGNYLVFFHGDRGEYTYNADEVVDQEKLDLHLKETKYPDMIDEIVGKGLYRGEESSRCRLVPISSRRNTGF